MVPAFGLEVAQPSQRVGKDRMLKHIARRQLKALRLKYQRLVGARPLAFAHLTPAKVPKAAGVYLITMLKGPYERPYYVGRTKNFRQRLYNNHLLGPLSNARLKKHLIDAGECRDAHDAKAFIRRYCVVRWVKQEGFRQRGALEGYVTGLLFPKHGIYEEH